MWSFVMLTACATDPADKAAKPIEKPKLAQPLLWTGESAPDGFVIDPTAFNGDSEYLGQVRVDYVGSLNPDQSYRGSPAEAAELRLIRHFGGSAAELTGQLRLDFENDPLDYAVQQMLGGFLGVNYIAVDSLVGDVTFRNETPITRSQVLPIVRSILAQNGYLMKSIDGVLHIGQAGRIGAAEQIISAGRQGDLVTRFLPVNGPIKPSLVQTISAIVPSGIAVGIAPDGKSLLVRAAPDEIEEVAQLVASFTESDQSQNLFAIIYLHHSAPEAMATQLMSFFASQTLSESDLPKSIVPLVGKQALLVSASNNAAIENVRRMAGQLDFRLDDEATLRIIPLRHVDATIMAEQLASAFTSEKPVISVSPATKATAADDGGNAGSGGDDADSAESGAEERIASAFADQPGATTISLDSSSPSILPDMRNNALLVRSSYRVYKRIVEAVEVLDVPLSQVVIEATILEVKITDALKYGVQWYLSGSGFTVRNSSTAGVDDSGLTGFVATVEELASGISVNAVIDALDDVTEVSVVSSPYLTVLDRKTARLVVGDQIPFTTKSQSASSEGDVAVTQEITTRDTGVILEVQPVIRGDNSIELRIVQELSTPILTTGTVNLTPTITTRQITSDVMVYSGRTVLLGGLIQDRKDNITTGVPLLRDAPLVGKLFEQTSNTDSRTEVIVLITPRVTRKSNEIERITDQLRNHLNLGGSYPDAPL